MDNTPTVNIRVQCKAGQHVIKDLSLGVTVSELRNKLAEISGITSSKIKVLHGYPPRLLDLSDLNAKLTTLELRSGDTLKVEQMAADENSVDTGSNIPSGQSGKSDAGRSNLSESAARRETEVLQTINAQIGILMKKDVPPNNSCLFTSIDYVMNDGRSVDLKSAEPMRKLVARIVAADQVKYNEGILGQNNESYCRWILDEKSWGGAIEVSILAQHYQIEIDVINAQSGRIERFGENENYPRRVFLFYDGTHYDPLAYEDPQSSRVIKTKFSTLSEPEIWDDAMLIASQAQQSRQYTDLHAGMMQCRDCGMFVKGEGEMLKHTRETRHINYSEVK